jgi:hypothetical protein
MKSQKFSKVFKTKPGQNVGLILVKREHPTKACIGILLSNHKSMTDALIERMLYLEGKKNARTRLVHLIRFMEPGTEIDPRVDLRPIRSEVSR